MTPSHAISRRSFVGGTVAACSAAALSTAHAAAAHAALADDSLSFPLVDYHVHLDSSSLDQVLPLSRQRGVRFGIVEHAGTRENKYPVVLSTDEQLAAYIKRLDGKGVYKGVQAEWTDWMTCFSADVLARLDYILTDAMTFPGKNGRRVKLWEKGADGLVDMSNHDAFMDRFVEWHVEIMSTEPFDILANASWLPEPLAREYDALWTEGRVRKVVDAAVTYGVAIEISSSYKLPRLAFLKQAQAAGVKFSFGSNGRYPNMGKLDYSIAMARALGLRAADMFTPGADGRKAVQRRNRHRQVGSRR
jgi:histidinol phosphatase-like PHP family hydrolase